MCGGVKCSKCSNLHAIVTGMSTSLYETDDILEGEPRMLHSSVCLLYCSTIRKVFCVIPTDGYF